MKRVVNLYDDYSYDDREYGDDRRHPDDRGYPDYGDEPRRPPPPRDHRRPPPQSPRGPPPGKKPFSYKMIGGMVVAIVALIFIFIFMSYPWYNIGYTAQHENLDSNMEFNLEYKINDFSYEIKFMNITDKDTLEYDNESFKEPMKDVKEVMDNTNLISIIAMIFIIIAIIVIPIAAMAKIPHFVGIIFLVLGILFLIIIPLYFFFSFPPALENQFDKMQETFPSPMNETFKYKKEFLSSGSGNWNNWDYDQKWEPGMAFWLIFVPLITLVVAEVVYASGKHDHAFPMAPERSGRPPPPPREAGGPREPREPREPRGRGRPVRDYGPPRPMRDEDYDYIPSSRRPPRGDEYGYREPPPPPRRGGYDDDYPPPSRPPPRPPRRRD